MVDKKRLHMLWKYYKVGSWHVVSASVTDEERMLLHQYYGIDYEEL